MDKLDAVLKLHRVESRYYVPGYKNGSFDTKEGAEEYAGYFDEVPEVKRFEVCAHCGNLETGSDQNYESRSYDASLWPCRTVSIITGQQR